MLSGFDNFDSLVLSDKLLLCVDSSLLSDIFRHKNFSNPCRIGQVMSWRMFLKLGAAGSTSIPRVLTDRKIRFLVTNGVLANLERTSMSHFVPLWYSRIIQSFFFEIYISIITFFIKKPDFVYLKKSACRGFAWPPGFKKIHQLITWPILHGFSKFLALNISERNEECNQNVFELLEMKMSMHNKTYWLGASYTWYKLKIPEFSAGRKRP